MEHEAAGLRRELAGTEKKRARLAWLDLQMNRARAFLQGDALIDKPKSRHGFVGGRRAKPIQQGSSVWWTAKMLYQSQQPMHIDRILPRVQEQSGLKFKKATVVSNLSRYVKYGDTFNRPAPNVYGLIDFSQNPDPTERGITFGEFENEIDLDLEEEPTPP
jgi:hypothetical protein